MAVGGLSDVGVGKLGGEWADDEREVCGKSLSLPCEVCP